MSVSNDLEKDIPENFIENAKSDLDKYIKI